MPEPRPHDAGATEGHRRPRLRDHPLLLALTIAGTVIETIVLSALGQRAATGLAPQGTAAPPFGVFHDLRWLLVFHRSWWSFAGEGLALIGARTLLVASLVAAAWPRDVVLPRFRTLLRRAAVFVTVSAVLLLPSAALLFGLAVVPVSWLFFVAVPTALIVAFVVHHAVAGNGGWRSTPTLRTVGWVALTFLILTVAAGTVTAAPWYPARLAAAAAAGLFNAWAWLGIVHSVVRRTDPVPVPVAPIGVAVLAGIVVGGAAIGFSTVSGSSELRGDVEARPPKAGRPVLLVTGFASDWNGSTSNHLPGAFAEWRFSYRGVGPGGLPAPYDAGDTDRPLSALVDTMDRQVRALAARTGQDVAVVAESEGALLAKTYLLARPGVPVSDLVLLSPLVDPARVYYPPPGQDGWGMVAGRILAAAAAGIRWVSPLKLSANGPLLRGIVDRVALRRSLACRVPHVREQALFPLADAVAPPHVSDFGIPTEVVPSFHGGLLGDVDAQRAIALALQHRELPHRAVLHVAERAIRYGASAWQVPMLPPALNDAWTSPPDDCAAVRASLAASLRR